MRERTFITVKEVAARAGVGPATAARALGAYGRVSDTTRARVLAAAAELGYQPHALARSMVTRVTHTMGLVVADIENLFFARIARAVTDVARQHGYAVLLLNTDEDLECERAAVQVLAENRVDGLIVVPSSGTEAEHLLPLAQRHTPVVLLDRSLAGVELDTVMIDNVVAARRAVAYLTGLGHRRVGLLTASATLATSTARQAGYRQALFEAGVAVHDSWVRITDGTRPSARRETAVLLSLPPACRPTALVATDSLLAADALHTIQERGLAIPDDVSLIGFDDADWMSLVRPAITVVDQPVYELGKRAAERLMARIAGDDGPPQQIHLETTLLVRGSCAVPPNLDHARGHE